MKQFSSITASVWLLISCWSCTCLMRSASLAWRQKNHGEKSK